MPKLSKAEKLRRNRESVRKYKKTEKGRKTQRLEKRRRYRTIKESEASDAVEIMLAKARREAYISGFLGAITMKKVAQRAVKYHDELEAWKNNKIRSTGIYRKLLEDTEKYSTAASDCWMRK